MEVKQSVDRIVNKAVNKDMDKATDASQWTSVLNQCLATFAGNFQNEHKNVNLIQLFF